MLFRDGQDGGAEGGACGEEMEDMAMMKQVLPSRLMPLGSVSTAGPESAVGPSGAFSRLLVQAAVAALGVCAFVACYCLLGANRRQ
jgi:hypothetical protein